MFGSLVVRDILTAGDNLSPTVPWRGARACEVPLLRHARAGSTHGTFDVERRAGFFLCNEGEGEVSAGGKTEPLPREAPCSSRRAWSSPCTTPEKTNSQPTWSAIPPSGIQAAFVVSIKDEAQLPQSAPADPSPFTNPGAGGHWAHITHGFFNGNGLATVGAIITVEILPMQLGEPHPHFPGHEEIWCEIEGKSLAFYGSQLRMQHPGEAYMLRPDNLTTHSKSILKNRNKPIEFLWFSTSTKVSTTPTKDLRI